MEFPAVSMKKTAPKRKSKMTQMGIMNSFTKPEMEAALLLIQLSSDSDRRSTTTTKSGGDDDDEFRVRLIKGMDETHQREHSQGSCDDDSKSNNNTYYNCNNYNSEVTSAMSATEPDIGPLAKKDLEEVDEDDVVACGPRRMIKKFRSLEELYRVTEPL